MARFTLRQLTYFSAVALHGGIAQAARALNVSQPAVAAAIDKLEDQLGIKLFHRMHARGVALTPQGGEALSRARWLLQSADRTAQDFQAIAAELIGHLRFGCYQTLAPFYTPGLVAAMRTRHPGVTLDVSEGRHDEIIPALAGHSLDLALVYAMDLDPHQLAWEHVKTLDPYVLLPAGHPLADQDPISLTALADEPYVMLDWPMTRDYFGSVLEAVGIDPPVAFRSQSYEVVRGAVANGLGFSLLSVRPKLDLTYDGAVVACRAIREPTPPINIVLAWPKDAPQSQLRENFLDLCHEYFTREARTMAFAAPPSG
jgi:DNA-binding transcriptional LysR family regulator